MDGHDVSTILERLDRIEQTRGHLVDRETVEACYSIDEFSRLVRKSEFTAREWCRLGRVVAKKRESGRGPHAQWVISHEERLRYRRDGLLLLRIESGFEGGRAAR
jgi:hypothetical protein